jgi:peptidoglycan/xylan/chitin deacetylase (PgdA/CDA1 family)
MPLVVHGFVMDWRRGQDPQQTPFDEDNAIRDIHDPRLWCTPGIPGRTSVFTCVSKRGTNTPGRRQENQPHSRHFVGRGLLCILAFLVLISCGKASIKSDRARGSLYPTITSSSCDTPPDVQPVSAAEIDIGNTSRPVIALTFDAGGPSQPTARILDTLANHQVHSTFFITGDWANENPDLVRRIHNDGHEIGNHTMHHPDLRTLSDQGLCTELNQADQVISSLTGATTRPYYRPPYGGRDNRVRTLAAQIGYQTVYWTIDTLDWQKTATPDSITKTVMANIKNGLIVLMHGGSQVEAETLDGLMTKIGLFSMILGAGDPGETRLRL